MREALLSPSFMQCAITNNMGAYTYTQRNIMNVLDVIFRRRLHPLTGFAASGA